MALSDVIREARIRRNLKQDDAAVLLDVTVQTYSKWENGITEPKASQVAKLSEILNVPMQLICSGQQAEKLAILEFVRAVSKHAKDLGEFELIEAIWQNINDDARFIDTLKQLNHKDEYEAVISMKKVTR